MADSPRPVLDPLPPVLSGCTLNLLAGASGVGKTSLIAYFAKCLIEGTPFLGHQPAQVPAVAYIGMDRPWTGDSQLWFEAYGLPDIPHYSLLEDHAFNLARFTQVKPGVHAQIFEDLLDKLDLPPGSVVFVDPIALCIGGDMNNYVRVAQGCINLYRVILRRQLCVIGIDHSSKQKGDSDNRYTRLQDRIGGSMAKLGYSATQMYLAGPEEMGEPCHTFLWNPHHAPSQTFHLIQDPTTGMFSAADSTQVTATPKADKPLHDRPLTEEHTALLLSIPNEPAWVSTADILSRATQQSRPTVYRHLKTLKERGLVTSPHPGQWSRVAVAQSVEN